VDEEDDYVEQFCDQCQGETDQRVSAEPSIATCLRCGTDNVVKSEEDRVAALLLRASQDAVASLRQLRESPVPSY
jgi:hypothetical protein